MAFELPERFDPEWLASRAWRQTEYMGLEICELGVLRRPKTAQIPGSLVYAAPNKDFPPRYRLTKPGGKKEKIVLNVEDIMREIFGRFANRKLLDYDYLYLMRTLCMEYNKRYFSRATLKDDDKTKDLGRGPVLKKRLCAGVRGKTCGKMISDYRCQACWILVRGGAVAEDDGISTYSLKL